MAVFTQRTTKYMLSAAPKQYHGWMVPKFRGSLPLCSAELIMGETYRVAYVAVGCKRLLFNNFGYLECLHKPNVRLVYDRLTEIVEDGVLMKGGAYSTIRDLKR